MTSIKESSWVYALHYVCVLIGGYRAGLKVTVTSDITIHCLHFNTKLFTHTKLYLFVSTSILVFKTFFKKKLKIFLFYYYDPSNSTRILLTCESVE